MEAVEASAPTPEPAATETQMVAPDPAQAERQAAELAATEAADLAATKERLGILPSQTDGLEKPLDGDHNFHVVQEMLRPLEDGRSGWQYLGTLSNLLRGVRKEFKDKLPDLTFMRESVLNNVNLMLDKGGRTTNLYVIEGIPFEMVGITNEEVKAIVKEKGHEYLKKSGFNGQINSESNTPKKIAEYYGFEPLSYEESVQSFIDRLNSDDLFPVMQEFQNLVNAGEFGDATSRDPNLRSTISKYYEKVYQKLQSEGRGGNLPSEMGTYVNGKLKEIDSIRKRTGFDSNPY